MGYERNDDRYGRDGRYGGGGDHGRGRGGYDRDGERGFFDRAGDEVRSWFGDEEAERRRRRDEMEDERYDRYAARDAGGYRRPEGYPAWARSNRDDGYARRATPAAPAYSGVRYDRTDEGRQFDDGGYARDAHGYGESDYAARSVRGRDDYRPAGRDRGDAYRVADRDRPAGYGAARRDEDDHGDYRSWRDRQVDAFDRDYDEYRRENRQRFESEFATWRTNRQAQRDSLGQVKEHQAVVGSDGGHVGTVDHVRSDHILLAKNDPDAGGHHHAIPSSWVQGVAADTVTLNRTADDAKRAWRDAEGRGGLFGGGRDDKDADPRGGNLNRSFSGTY